MQRPATPDEALATPLAQLRDLSLEVRCACWWSSNPSIRLMLAERPHLASVPLGRIVMRLRCQRTCRGKPTRVALLNVVEHATWAGQQSRPRPWELVLIGENEPD